jgi:hypothetical protein
MPQLVNNERSPFTDVVRLTAADFIAIGNGGQRRIATIPAGGAVELCTITNTIDIAGSSSLVVDIGTTVGDPDEFIDALNVSSATVGLPVSNTGDAFVQTAGNTTIKGGSLPVSAVSTATPIVIEVTDAAVASITAGEVVIGLRILDLTKFAA